jgi:hypothetical protein
VGKNKRSHAKNAKNAKEEKQEIFVWPTGFCTTFEMLGLAAFFRKIPRPLQEVVPGSGFVFFIFADIR